MQFRLLVLMIAAVTVLVACGGSSSPVGTSTPRISDAPVASVDSGYTNAEKAAQVIDNIDVVYCGSEPFSDWCAYLGRSAGAQPSVVAPVAVAPRALTVPEPLDPEIAAILGESLREYAEAGLDVEMFGSPDPCPA